MNQVARERRYERERRDSRDRRVADLPVEVDARSGRERRAGIERRLEIGTATGQVHVALGLLTRAVESGALGDDQRRLVDSAMVRLRFAIERLSGGDTE